MDPARRLSHGGPGLCRPAFRTGKADGSRPQAKAKAGKGQAQEGDLIAIPWIDQHQRRSTAEREESYHSVADLAPFE